MMIDDDSMELFKNFGWYQSHFWPGKPVRKKSMYVLEKKSIKIPMFGLFCSLKLANEMLLLTLAY